MKYKTLFRLALKFLGAWLIIEWIISILPIMISIMTLTLTRRSSVINSILSVQVHDLVAWLPSLLRLAIAVYLFKGGEWIVNLAIPSNKPYCHECGYLLKDLKGSRCPECDTPFRADSSTNA